MCILCLESMNLNEFMHPRNIYKAKKPDFQQLALKYPYFREYVKYDAKDRAYLNFKDPSALKALTCTLLKQDFELVVDFPVDRLIPTVPQRLNYILWLEDILESVNSTNLSYHGIDIGTGASCIYALLGAKLHGWHFLAADLDSTNLLFAQNNVQANKLDELIKVVKWDLPGFLSELVYKQDRVFDFVMCNPPFFSTTNEAHSVCPYKSQRHSTTVPAEIEGVCSGGEVEFISKLIEQSLILRNRIRVYTSMLGIKKSVSVLKERLKERDITHFSSNEFCQGKTMRWCLAWSFDPSVIFPAPYFKPKKRRTTKPLILELSNDQIAPDNVGTLLETSFKELHMHIKQQSSTQLTVAAFENTWSHQRRKRREAERQKNLSNPEKNTEISDDSMEVSSESIIDDTEKEQESRNRKRSLENNNSELGRLSDSSQSPPIKRTRTDSFDHEMDAGDSEMSLNCNDPDWAREPSVHFTCELKLTEKCTEVHLTWLDGMSRDSLHQIFQFLKNKFECLLIHA